MSFDNDAFFAAFQAAMATQAGNQAAEYADEASGLAAQRVTDASVNCQKSLDAAEELQDLHAATGQLPNPATPGCTP